METITHQTHVSRAQRTVPEKPKAATDQEFVKKAIELWRKCSDSEKDNRDHWLEDVKFSYGEGQWPEPVKQMRNTQKRPCLTINRTRQPIKLVANEQRQQRPSIQVSPVGDGASKEVAEIYQGIIRHIEYISAADQADDIAFDHVLRGGWGYTGIKTGYAHDGSFDQEIYIELIDNPMTIYWDPESKKPDGSDAMFAFEVRDYSHKKYREKFKKTEMASLTEMMSVGDHTPDWLDKEKIRVARYWQVKQEQKSLLLMSNGEKIFREDTEAALIGLGPEVDPEDARPYVVKERVEWARKVVCDTINAVEVIRHEEWPGQYIPRIPSYGDRINIDGKTRISGIVRDMRDPCQAYNVQVSAATEMVGMMSRAQWMMAEGQDENHENEFASANASGINTLHYKPVVGPNGELVPPPQRQVYEPAIQAYMQLTRQADADIQATSGLHDPSLGRDKRDQSGKAIQSLQAQSQIGTSNYSDNLARSMRHRGIVLIDLIPKIYDAPRIARIINPDMTHAAVGVYNSKQLVDAGVHEDADAAHAAAREALLPKILEAHPDMKDLPEEQRTAQAIKKIFDLGTGRYDVQVHVGPSFNSRRQEASAAMLNYMKIDPQATPIMRDLLLSNQDWHGAEEMAKRARKMLPPGIAEDTQGTVADLQAQLQALSHNSQQQMELIQKQQMLLSTKLAELESKKEIALINASAKLEAAEISTKAQTEIARHEVDADVQLRIHQSAHEVAMASHQNSLPPQQPPAEAQPDAEQPAPEPEQEPQGALPDDLQ